MTETAMTGQEMAVLNWFERASDIPDKGRVWERAATEAECEAVAAALAIPACKSLAARFRIVPVGAGRYRLTGRVDAVVTQTCVVEIEDFDQAVGQDVEIEFWPESQLAGGDDEGTEILVDALEGEDPEPIRNGRLEIGAVVYQLLAASLDPFPRKPGAELEVREAAGDGDRGPFAALAALRRATDEGSSTDGS